MADNQPQSDATARQQRQRPLRLGSMAANSGDYVLLTPRQVAKIFGVSTRTLERWRVDGTGPRHSKINGLVRYKNTDVHAYVEESSRASTSG